MKRLHVNGIAFWAPRLPGWELAAPALRDEGQLAEVASARPAPALLPPNERRRAPDTVAVAMEVASRACAGAGLRPHNIASVFTSTHGDLAITDYMCSTLASTPDMISPTKFHNSVHNAAAGYWSIATGCMAPYTAVSAWHQSFAAGLLEAITQAECEGAPVLFVAYDIEAKGPLAGMADTQGVLAGALILAPEAGEHTLAILDWQTSAAQNIIDSQPRSAAAKQLPVNAMRACLPLFEVLAGRDARPLRYILGAQLALDLLITPRQSP